jgi:hypothetical protein
MTSCEQESSVLPRSLSKMRSVIKLQKFSKKESGVSSCAHPVFLAMCYYQIFVFLRAE